MLGDDAEDWSSALFQGEGGLQRRRILLVGGRAPVVVRIPTDDEGFEEFCIDGWSDGEPVYRTTGFVPREHPEEGM